MYMPEPSTKLLNSFVAISRFNKGEAGKIIDEVHEEGFKIIIKNNEPVCVMITPEFFIPWHIAGSNIKRRCFST